MPAQSLSSIDPAEVSRFSDLAAEWWDPNGKFAALHRLNPVRLAFIREAALARFGREAKERAPFAGLRLLDIGCGGGLACEPMARLGFSVTGIDAAQQTISIAAAHAAQRGLAIAYRAGAVEALLAAGEAPFDVILNLEVIEHVVDPGAFLRNCARLMAPGGLMVVGTLNRTLNALALAKFGAEYLLRWIPPGTHDWRKFITPDEMRGFLAATPNTVEGPFGIAFNPLAGRWSRSSDAQVNYLMTVTAPPGPRARRRAQLTSPVRGDHGAGPT